MKKVVADESPNNDEDDNVSVVEDNVPVRGVIKSMEDENEDSDEEEDEEEELEISKSKKKLDKDATQKIENVLPTPTPEPAPPPPPPGRRGKKQKIVPELTSLDKWILMMEEKAKSEPPKELTPEEIAGQKEQQKAQAKLTKAERAKLKAQQDANLRREQMAAYAQWKIEEAERIERERIALEKREIREQLELGTRIIQLRESNEKIRKMNNDAWNSDMEVFIANDWTLFLQCSKLPYPVNCQDMNAYIGYWKEVQHKSTLDDHIVRINDVMHLLTALYRQINKPLVATVNQINEWKEISINLIRTLKVDMDFATYHLLRNVFINMTSVEARTAKYYIDTEYFTLSLWTKLKVPIPVYDPCAIATPPITVVFEEMAMTVHFPEEIHCTGSALRALRMKYDHLSYKCTTYSDPDEPDEFKIDFLAYSQREWVIKQRIKYSRRKRKVKIDEHGKEVVVEEDMYYEDNDPIWQERIIYDRTIWPVPSEIIEDQEADVCTQILKRLKAKELPATINLRKYIIVGGTMSIDFVHQPPQPKRLMMDAVVTALLLPKELQNIPFYEPLPDPNTPYDDMIAKIHKDRKRRMLAKNISSRMFIDDSSENVLQACSSLLDSKSEVYQKISQLLTTLSQQTERKELASIAEEKSPQQMLDDRHEAYLDRLVSINLPMPPEVIWFEKPTLCYWNRRKRTWNTTFIENFETNETFTTASFKTGIFGVFSWAVQRHANFPFYNWKITPSNSSKDITLTIETPLIEVDITVRDNNFALTKIKGVEKSQIKDIYSVFMKLHELKHAIRMKGIDLFPTFDTFCYVDQNSQKYWVLERHLYYCMAIIAPAYKFKSSKWNVTAGSRKIIIRMKEATLKKWSTVLMTQMRTYFIEATEDNPELNLTPTKGVKFAADLYQLSKDTGSSISKKKLLTAPCNINLAVCELLIATRVLSFTYFKPHKEEIPTHPKDNEI